MEPQRITAQEAKRRQDAGEPVVFVDSRSEHAWADSDVMIPGAIRVPPDEVEQHLDQVPRTGLIVTYCT